MAIHWDDPVPIVAPITRFPALGPTGGQAGAYRVVASRPLARLCGEDVTLYIGSAVRLAQRLSKQHGVLPKLRELSTRLPEVTYSLQVHAIAPEQVPDGLTLAAWARLLETAELNAYAAEHFELPPLNGRSEGFIAGRAMQAVAETMVVHNLGITGALAPTDEEENALTYLPLVLSRGQKRHAQMPQLLWTWPEAWWGIDTPWWRDPKSFGKQSNLSLVPDTLYAFVPSGNPLEAYISAQAKLHNLLDDGSQWWVLALTEEGWRERKLIAFEPDMLRDAIIEPVTQLMASKKT
jgi:hypothetical protein